MPGILFPFFLRIIWVPCDSKHFCFLKENLNYFLSSLSLSLSTPPLIFAGLCTEAKWRTLWLHYTELKSDKTSEGKNTLASDSSCFFGRLVHQFLPKFTPQKHLLATRTETSIYSCASIFLSKSILEILFPPCSSVSPASSSVIAAQLKSLRNLSLLFLKRKKKMDGLLLICQVRNIGGNDWILTLQFSNCRMEGVWLVAFLKSYIQEKKETKRDWNKSKVRQQFLNLYTGSP